MKLLQRPNRVTEYIDFGGSGAQRFAGRATIENIKILIPDKEDSKEEVWHKLKYGTAADFVIGQKIDQLTFQEDDGIIAVYGILPISFERSLIWEGKIVECSVDHYIINDIGTI